MSEVAAAPRCRPVSGTGWIGLRELEGRGAEWRELAASCVFPTAYTDPAWVLAWVRWYGAGCEPWAFALEDGDNRLRGLALMVLRRRRSVRTLGFAGESWNGLESVLSAPGAEEETADALLAGLAARRREWDVWRTHRLPTGSALARRLLCDGAPLRAAAHDLRAQPFIALPDEPDAFDRRFRRKHRTTQRREWRRLTELGAQVELVTDPQAVGPAVRTLLRLRRSRASEKGQPHRHMDERFERFLVDAVAGLLPDRARLWQLQLDGETIASRLNLVQGPREHSFLIGLDDRHAALSPGKSLELYAIRHAIEEGRDEVDLGPGRAEYKYRLGAENRELTRLIVSSGSARGRAMGMAGAIDLRLRASAPAGALRRLRRITPERADAPPPGERPADARAES